MGEGGGGGDSDIFFFWPEKTLCKNKHNGVGVHHQYAWLTSELPRKEKKPEKNEKKNHKGGAITPPPVAPRLVVE